MIPLSECQNVNLRDKATVNITALHETGHLIAMYAMDMMEYFAYITIQAGDRTIEMNREAQPTGGITAVTDQLYFKLQKFDDEKAEIANNQNTGRGKTEYYRKFKLEGAALCLPQLCRLFGGGAICRYYGVPDEIMCSIDYGIIDKVLDEDFELPGTRETFRILVDMYLKSVFESFDKLTKAIYMNLVAKGTLNKEEVKQIIDEWEALQIS